jgi:hypothetical protein
LGSCPRRAAPVKRQPRTARPGPASRPKQRRAARAWVGSHGRPLSAAKPPSRAGPCLGVEGRTSSRTAGWPTTTYGASPGVSGPAIGVGSGVAGDPPCMPDKRPPAYQAAGPAPARRPGHRAACARCHFCQDIKTWLCLLSAPATGADAGRRTGGRAARARARQQRLGARDGHVEALGVAPEGQVEVGRRAARAGRGRPRQRFRPRQNLRPGRRRPLNTFALRPRLVDASRSVFRCRESQCLVRSAAVLAMRRRCRPVPSRPRFAACTVA